MQNKKNSCILKTSVKNYYGGESAMKNVKKLLKKAMVFTLAASMLVGTPLTASAAGIRGVYSISDGDKTVSGNSNDSGTGTVTNTNTDTGSGVLNDNDAAIIGIVLDKDTVNAEAGEPETLTATIITDGDVSEEDLDKLKSKIHWELSNADDVEGEPAKRNPAAYVGISTPNGAGDRTLLKLNPKKGTKAGEEVIVTAKIDNTYYFDKDGNLKEYVTKREPYMASATVSVKQYSDKLELKGMTTPYLKHTVDLNDYLVRTPATANDEITWISTNTKIATVTAAGVVTFKKVNAKEDGSLTNPKDACYIIAAGERVQSEPWDVRVQAGTPASKVLIVRADNDQAFTKNTTTVDLNSGIENQEGWTGKSNDVEVQVYAKIKKAKTYIDENGVEQVSKKNDKVQTETKDVLEGDAYYDVEGNLVPEGSWTVTDDIVWSSTKDAFASVKADDDKGRSATITANGVGTATITAKASSGKSSKLKVVVKATLADIWIAEYENGPELSDPGLYSGQSMQLYVGRDPAENKDAVKWSIEKVQEIKDGVPQYKGDKPKMIANPNATINAKGVLTIKAKVDTTYPVTVKLEPKKKVMVVNSTTGEEEELCDTVEFQVEQASIEEITVTEDGYSAPIARVYVNDKSKVVQDNTTKNDNTREIAIPKNKTYTAAVVASAGYDNYVGAADILTWKSSNAKVAELTPDRGGNVKITAKATGTSTITVSGIRVTTNAKNGKETASVIKTTFKVSVKQPVKTVTLNKPSVVLNQKEKKVKGNNEVQDQKVALKATLGPKGVNAKKEAITWTVKQTAGEPHDPNKMTNAALGLEKKGQKVTAASVSVNLPQPVVGDEFEITARTKSGASATTTVKIVKTTTGVEIREKDATGPYAGNKTEIPFGGSVSIKTYINTGAKNSPDWELAGTDNREDVTYSVNKKGIVSIDNDGNIHAINSGTVTITAKTPLNKKATLKVTVAKPVTN